jgi:hypothetical protein
VGWASSEANELISKYIEESTKIQYPSTWEPQQNDIELKPLANNGAEWKQIEKRMRETLPSIQISKIERVQNRHLWEKYTSSKKLLEKKRNPNELELFHGTRNTPPLQIYGASDVGFDMRFSSLGMWGRANYFAEKASYSHAYCHSPQNSTEGQIFLAQVLVGDAIHIMPADASLIKPPPKAQNSVTGFAEDYDSVSGETKGSKVYMIYDNAKAYPKYLITYRILSDSNYAIATGLSSLSTNSKLLSKLFSSVNQM